MPSAAVCDGVAGVAQDLGEALAHAGLVVGDEDRLGHWRRMLFEPHTRGQPAVKLDLRARPYRGTCAVGMCDAESSHAG